MEDSLVSSFFKDVSPNAGLNDDAFYDYMFIAANEWHWSAKEFLETDIPVLYELLGKRDKYIDEMNKRNKRR